MADFQFNTNLGPQAQQGTNIADMVNLARGVQAYQQAQELNPLAVQKAKMEVEQLGKLNPLAERKAKAETQTAEFGLAKSYAEKERGVLGGLANDPDFINGNKEGIIAKLKSAKSFLKAIGVPDHPEDTTDQIMQLAEKDSKTVLPYIKNMIQGEIGATGQQGLQTPQLGTVAGAPATFVAGTATAKPLTIGGNTGVTPTGGQGNPPPAGQGVTPTQMSLQYPVRRAGDIRPYAPSEVEDQKQGETYRNSLVSGATTQTTALRNLDEVIKQAQSLKQSEWNEGAGLFGTIGRNISTFLGTEEGIRYKQLSKDLANASLANMKAMGLSTDADKTLIAAANGDYTYPPKILEEIAHRNLADMKNIELQSRGAQNFAKKYGDNNMKTFQDLWGQNSKDSRVFEAISINESNLPKEEKIKRIDELFKGLTAEQIQRLTQQKNNLLKLSRTGEL